MNQTGFEFEKQDRDKNIYCRKLEFVLAQFLRDLCLTYELTFLNNYETYT